MQYAGTNEKLIKLNYPGILSTNIEMHLKSKYIGKLVKNFKILQMNYVYYRINCFRLII